MEPVIGAGTTLTTSGSGIQPIEEFISEQVGIQTDIIPGGNWNIEKFFSLSSNAHTAEVYAEIYVRNIAGVETLIGSNQPTPHFINEGTNIELYLFSVGVNTTITALTDRIVIKLFAQNLAGHVLFSYYEDSRIGQVTTSISPLVHGNVVTSYSPVVLQCGDGITPNALSQYYYWFLTPFSFDVNFITFYNNGGGGIVRAGIYSGDILSGGSLLGEISVTAVVGLNKVQLNNTVFMKEGDIYTIGFYQEATVSLLQQTAIASGTFGGSFASVLLTGMPSTIPVLLPSAVRICTIFSRK